MSYQRDAESPDERRQRQRRARLTLLVVAAVATAVIVPLVVHVRHSWADSGALPGSGGPAGTTVPSPPRITDPRQQWLDVDPEQPWLFDLAEDATALAQALDARGEARTLTAPARGARCPADTGAMSAVLGVPLGYEGDRLSDYPDRCEWSSVPPVGPAGDYVSVSIGFLAGWTEADLEDLAGDEDCWRTPVDAFAPPAVLEACLLRSARGSMWTLYVPDAGGTGVWTLDAATGDNQPISGPAALQAVVDVAGETW